jgi:phosphoadenosine phosphosulfate reductase
MKRKVNHKHGGKTAKTVEARPEDLEGAAPQDVLKWTVGRFEKIAVSVSFGKDSISVLHMLAKERIKPDIPVVYLNTGYEFKETIEFKERLKKEWNLDLREYKPDITIKELERLYGPDLYKVDPTLCCQLLKVEPIKRALKDFDAWITGLRRTETEFRKNIKVIEEYEGIVKINPLANWTEENVWNYIRWHDVPYNHIRWHDVPYNPLYDMGHRSIGCAPCTHIQGLRNFTESLKPLIIGENEDLIDRWLEITNKEAFEATRYIWNKGYPVGTSSGVNYLAARRIARERRDRLIVTLFPDIWFNSFRQMQRYIVMGKIEGR